MSLSAYKRASVPEIVWYISLGGVTNMLGIKVLKAIEWVIGFVELMSWFCAFPIPKFLTTLLTVNCMCLSVSTLHLFGCWAVDFQWFVNECFWCNIGAELKWSELKWSEILEMEINLFETTMSKLMISKALQLFVFIIFKINMNCWITEIRFNI